MSRAVQRVAAHLFCGNDRNWKRPWVDLILRPERCAPRSGRKPVVIERKKDLFATELDSCKPYRWQLHVNTKSNRGSFSLSLSPLSSFCRRWYTKDGWKKKKKDRTWRYRPLLTLSRTFLVFPPRSRRRFRVSRENRFLSSSRFFSRLDAKGSTSNNRFLVSIELEFLLRFRCIYDIGLLR